MSFGNQGARVWRKTGEKEMPKCLKSSVKYPQSVMVWGAMSAAGVGPLCFIKGKVNAASYFVEEENTSTHLSVLKKKRREHIYASISFEEEDNASISLGVEEEENTSTHLSVLKKKTTHLSV